LRFALSAFSFQLPALRFVLSALRFALEKSSGTFRTLPLTDFLHFAVLAFSSDLELTLALALDTIYAIISCGFRLAWVPVENILSHRTNFSSMPINIELIFDV